MKNKKRENTFIKHLIATPFIWLMIVPVVFSDILLEIYHRVTFPLYGVPYVKRSRYIRIDRQKLEYLDIYDKASCMYCGYINGWLHYALTVAGETEKYWCGIKHEDRDGFIPPEHHKDFLAYGDEEGFKKEYPTQS